MSSVKVLACHNHYSRKGGEALVFDNLVKGLRERGHPVVTYVRDNGEIDTLSFGARAGLVVAAYGSARTRRELTRLVAEEKPAVAIVQNVFPLLSPSVYTTLHRLDVRVIQATYNYRLVCPAAELYSRGEICERSLSGNYLHCVLRRCYRNSAALSAWYASILGWRRLTDTFSRAIDIFQVPDAFMADKLAEGGLPRAKMVTNVNPFFVREYTPTTTHDGYIAFVGRFVRHKGVLTLLRAVRGSANLRAVLVGEGDLLTELRAFAEQHGLGNRVQFAGALWGDELAQIMTRACAVAVPSEWYDNLPLVLCQANALGKPVLASRINGIPEYVQEGVNGFLFNPGNAEELGELAERMLSLGSEEYAAFATRARRFAEERLDFAEHYRVLSAVFDRLQGTRP
jgi:glycosyltransferase involved in cell wall biosynthesis